MKVLLLTDLPPCKNFTGGLVLDQLVRFLPSKSVVCFAVVNPEINARLSEDLDGIPVEYIRKPRERAVRARPHFIGHLSAFAFELYQGLKVKRLIQPRIAEFGKRHGIDRVWAVLQGQTILRLAKPVADSLGVPLLTQVWDPLGWWLRANNIDTLTKKHLFKKFDTTLASSRCCATASWAMSELYLNRYEVSSIPVISSLPAEFAKSSAKRLNNDSELVIGMAGQFYAETEWHALINALDIAQWRIGGRAVKIRVLGPGLQMFTQQPAHVEYLGWYSQKDTIRLLSEADILYLPYWFSEEFREEASLSFPSKLVTYFAAGRPVFFHGPSYASPARYLLENQAGIMCHSLSTDNIIEILESTVADTRGYANLTEAGRGCFERDFTLGTMKQSFLKFIGA